MVNSILGSCLKLTRKVFNTLHIWPLSSSTHSKIKSQIEVGQRCLSLIHTLTVLYCRYIHTNWFAYFFIFYWHNFRIVRSTNSEFQEILLNTYIHTYTKFGKQIFSQNWINLCACIPAILCTSWIHTSLKPLHWSMSQRDVHQTRALAVALQLWFVT